MISAKSNSGPYTEVLEENISFSLHYKLVKVSGVFGGISSPPRDVYSLLVLKEDGGELEYSFVFDISSDKKDAERILKALRKGKVSPCTALEIVSDLVGDSP